MKRTFLTALFFITVGLFAFSLDENPLERLVEGFKKYLEELPQEKVYLHFDRPYYTSGETIWFKAYLTAGAFHKPSELSHTIYVELINERGRLVRQVKLLSINGSASGDIVLSDSLSSGNYLVRAYTNWMKNSEEDYFFHHPIKIWDREAHPIAVPSEEKSIDIRFFPEGGDLVNGIPSRVAVKAVGPDGRGRNIKGKIVDESGAVAGEFKCNHLGMSVFSIFPQKGKSYKAIIENQPEVKLPPIKETGLVMSVNNSSSSNDVMVRMQTTDYANLKTIYILAQTRGIVCYAARADLSSNSLMTKIPKSKFPDGVAQITITDSNGIPLAERLVFINNGEQLNIKITPDKPTYAPRELVTLRIQATDNKGLPVMADLSLAACDDSQVFMDENRETIETYLLLSSELRGLIESPGYYFNPINVDRAEALDHLLLTQGWRRFSFKKAMEPEWQKPEYKVELGMSIKGRMVGKNNNKPIADGRVSYVTFIPVVDAKVVRTSSVGDFEINNIIYFDAANALLQGETKKGGKEIKFVINHSDFPVVHFLLLHSLSIPTEMERALIARSIEQKDIDRMFDHEEKTIMLKEVEIRPLDNINNVSMYGLGSVNKRVASDPALENLIHPLQLIQGVAGVLVTGSGQNWNVQIRGIGSMKSSAPLIMVDNMPVDIDALNMISIRDIESYSIWKGPEAAIFGSRGGNGAIAFYTKRGEWTAQSKEEGVFAFNEMGFQIERKFYTPQYDVEIPEHRKLDKRTTLFWAPHVQTDSDGFATVSFYNHDMETTVTGVIEGISTEGMPGVATVKYEIRKN